MNKSKYQSTCCVSLHLHPPVTGYFIDARLYLDVFTALPCKVERIFRHVMYIRYTEWYPWKIEYKMILCAIDMSVIWHLNGRNMLDRSLLPLIIYSLWDDIDIKKVNGICMPQVVVVVVVQSNKKNFLTEHVFLLVWPHFMPCREEFLSDTCAHKVRSVFYFEGYFCIVFG